MTLKCLEKEKERRYATANALARELERHLSDEVVEARPPTVSYRLKKTIRRNRVAVTAGSLVLLAIFAGAGLAVWQAIQATEANQETSVLLAGGYVEKGWECLEKGDASQALLWHTKALEVAANRGGVARNAELPYRQSAGWAWSLAPKPVGVLKPGIQFKVDHIWKDPNSDRAILVSPTTGIEVWDLRKGKVVIPRHSIKFELVAADEDRRRFALLANGEVALHHFDQPMKAIWTTQLEGNEDSTFQQLKFSHNAKLLVVASDQMVLTVLDSESGTVLRKLDLGDGLKRQNVELQMSEVDDLAATHSRSRGPNHVGIGNLHTGKVLFSNLYATNQKSTASAFSIDGKQFVLGENFKELRILDLATGRMEPSSLKLVNRISPTSVFFNSTGRNLFCRYGGGSITGWNWREKDRLFARTPGFKKLELEANREELLLTAVDRAGLLLNAQTGETTMLFQDSTDLRGATFLQELVVTGGQPGPSNPRPIPTVWKVPNNRRGQPLTNSGGGTGQSMSSRIQSSQYDPVNNLISTVVAEGATIWDSDTGEVVFRYYDANDPIYFARLFAEGRLLAVVGAQNIIKVIEIESGKLKTSIKPERPVYRIDVSPNGKWLAAQDYLETKPENLGETIRFWRLPGGELIHSIPAKLVYAERSGLRFTSDERFALMQSKDARYSDSEQNEATLLDLETGETWEYSADPEREMEMSWDTLVYKSAYFCANQLTFIDERTLVLGRSIWRIQPEGGMERIGRLRKPEDATTSTKIPGTSHVLVDHGVEGVFQAFDVETQAPVSIPISHGGKITALAVDPTGRIAASGGFRGRIRLWDLGTGLPVSPWMGEPESPEIVRLIFASNGKTLISMDREGKIRLWRIPTPVELPLEDLREVSETVARRKILEGGRLQPFSSEEVVERWEEGRHPQWTRADLPLIEDGGSISLFDGNSLGNWDARFSNDPGFSIRNGLLKLSRPDDETPQWIWAVDQNGKELQFRDFQLRLKYWAEPDGHGYVFFHSSKVKSGQPVPGNGVAIGGATTNPLFGDHAGSIPSLYAWKGDALVSGPNRWHELEIEVRGNRIVTRIDGTTVAFWEEPENWEGFSQPYLFTKKLGSGTFGLRLVRGTIFLKDIRVRRLDD